MNPLAAELEFRLDPELAVKVEFLQLFEALEWETELAALETLKRPLRVLVGDTLRVEYPEEPQVEDALFPFAGLRPRDHCSVFEAEPLCACPSTGLYIDGGAVVSKLLSESSIWKGVNIKVIMVFGLGKTRKGEIKIKDRTENSQ